MKTNTAKKALSKAAIYAILIICAAIVLLPILWMLSTSIKIESETLAIPPRWIPEHPTLEAYSRLWQEYPFLTYFKNSAIVVMCAVTFTIVFSTLAGYGVTRFNFRGKASFVSFLLITQMFPTVMLLIPYYKVLSTYNLDDTLLGLTLVYISFTIPFCSWLMIGYYKTIPLALDEAAILDGCNRFQVLWRVILPLTKPGLITAGIYAFITAWNDYMFAQTLINSPVNKTIPLGIADFNGYYKIMWNDLMAASVIASIPVIILFIFMQKHFVSGLTAGAVK